MSEMKAEVVIAEADTAGDDLAFVKTLFVEYAESLDFNLCFQGFDEELAGLPGSYAKPGGNLWLARVDGAIAGCVGMRPHRDGAAEIKRLFVRPGFRGHRLGSRLTKTVIDAARDGGYSALRLDTARQTMSQAQAIYRQLGFVECSAFDDGDTPVELTYYELDLSGPG